MGCIAYQYAEGVTWGGGVESLMRCNIYQHSGGITNHMLGGHHYQYDRDLETYT